VVVTGIGVFGELLLAEVRGLIGCCAFEGVCGDKRLCCILGSEDVAISPAQMPKELSVAFCLKIRMVRLRAYEGVWQTPRSKCVLAHMYRQRKCECVKGDLRT